MSGARPTFYHQIAVNRRRSVLLTLIVAGLLGLLGFGIGYAVGGDVVYGIPVLVGVVLLTFIVSIGTYFAGDGAKKDDDGDIWLLGRVDDVMNVSGHRISTTEVESALVSHPAVAEAAVVGANDATTGQAIVAFVIARGGAPAETAELVAELRDHVAREIGPIAKPREVFVVAELPKTRSGKIMRRLLRDVAEHRELGDTTTLTDAAVMATITGRLAGGPGAEEG
jgi:acetyl-CoA synthetase